MSNFIFVDCEAAGPSPVKGQMTEFGAVHEKSLATFHGRLYEGSPDPQNPAKPIVGKRLHTEKEVAEKFSKWLKSVCGNGQPIFVSDNVAYDWQWISALFAVADMNNPFGHSGRRISDYWAGLQKDFMNTQKWKHFRVTKHTHNPVDDAMGNVEAFKKIQEMVNGNQER